MGADSTIVFYGLRYETDGSESGPLQQRTDPRIVRARDHQLAHWWGNFSRDDIEEQAYLFIGRLVGHIGHEGKYELSLNNDEINALIETTRTKLNAAGFDGEPRLYIQFEPDY
jgi:hypothetical protein